MFAALQMAHFGRNLLLSFSTRALTTRFSATTTGCSTTAAIAAAAGALIPIATAFPRGRTRPGPGGFLARCCRLAARPRAGSCASSGFSACTRRLRAGLSPTATGRLLRCCHWYSLLVVLPRTHFHVRVLNVNQPKCVGLCVNGVHSCSRAARVIVKCISLD